MNGIAAIFWAVVVTANLNHPQDDVRVVYCEKRVDACAQTSEVLGKDGTAFWATVSNNALLVNSTSRPTVLYFDRAQYDQAMAGLREPDQRLAIQHRLKRAKESRALWASSAILGALRRTAAAVRDGGDGPSLESLVAAAAEVGGRDRLKSMEPSELLDIGIDDINQLLAERVPETEESLKREGQSLGQLLQANTGNPRGRLVQAGTQKLVYFVAPMPFTHVASLERGGRPAKAFRDGVVTMVLPHEHATMVGQGRQAKLMYPGKEPFLGDLYDLTEAQLDVRLAQRLSGMPASARNDFLGWLTFEHAILGERSKAALEGTPHARWLNTPSWKTATDSRMQTLRTMLAITDPEAPRERHARLAQLKRELALASVLARDAGDTAFQATLKRMSTRLGF